MALQVRNRGGAPYIVSAAPLRQPLVFRSPAEGRAIYQWRDTATAAGASLRPY
jgi:hypothetical protein